MLTPQIPPIPPDKSIIAACKSDNIPKAFPPKISEIIKINAKKQPEIVSPFISPLHFLIFEATQNFFADGRRNHDREIKKYDIYLSYQRR